MRFNQGIRGTLITAMIIVDCLVPRGTFAAVSRKQEADSSISSNHLNTWSLPTSTDTLVGRASGDVLTNKSISGSTNTLTNLPTSALSGQVAIANGGTGASTLTANSLLAGNGTSAINFIAPGTAGNVLTSNGTVWASSAAPAATVGVNQVQDVFYGGGSTSTYTLSYAPTLAAEVLCHIDGLSLIQGTGKDYTVNIAGPTVTLSSALAVGQNLLCYYNKY